MARMYPSHLDEETQSYAERKLYYLFRDMPGTEDWHVLHSVCLARHPTQSQGEADFVVIVPDEGTFVLEVKGGGISVAAGTWYSRNRNGVNLIKNPVSEASNAMFAIRDFVKNNGQAGLDLTLFGFGVVFPDSTVHGRFQIPDLDDCQIADAEDLHDMKGYLLKLARFCRSRKTPNIGIPHKAEADALAALLRPVYDFRLSVATQVHNVERQIIELTENQRDVFEGQLENDRCLTKGSAGTGKTVIAVECARWLAKQGKRVALFCYNRYLAAWLQECLSGEEGNVCDAILEYMEKALGEKLPVESREKNPREYYGKQLPALFAEHLIDSQAEPFDCIIVDEAQDVFEPAYLEAIDLMLYGGLENGRWYFFMDAEQQNLYSSGLSFEKVTEMLRGYHSFYAKYTLRDNCRNSEAIIEKVDAVFGTHTRFRKMEERGTDVVIRTCKKSRDEAELLEQIVLRLLRDGIAPDDIALLSALKYERSAACELTAAEVSRDRKNRKGKILFSTVHAFKGLESPVVILIDFENLNYDSQKNLLYVGMTRARSGLYMILGANAWKQAEQMMRESANHAE